MPLPVGWTNDNSGWALIQDTIFTNVSPLVIDADHTFEFDTATTVTQGGQLFKNLTDPVFDTLFPTQLNDFYHGQLTFKSEVPPGTNHFISLSMESGGLTIFEDQRLYLMPPQAIQSFAMTALVPTTQFIFDNGIEVHLSPSAEVDIFAVELVWNRTFNVGLA